MKFLGSCKSGRRLGAATAASSIQDIAHRHDVEYRDFPLDLSPKPLPHFGFVADS